MILTALTYLLIAFLVLILLGIMLSPLALLSGLWASTSAKADAQVLAELDRS